MYCNIFNKYIKPKKTKIYSKSLTYSFVSSNSIKNMKKDLKKKNKLKY